MSKLALALAAYMLATPVVAQEILVIDGDTFELDGQVIRLWGIDAPERNQTCVGEGGETVPIDEIAAETLGDLLISERPCEPVAIDQHGRTIARCTGWTGRNRGGSYSIATDLGLTLVLMGLAWDWPEYSDGLYQSAQETARSYGFGVWAYDCIPPWEWREQNPE